jgi:D-alanyl-D-alanine carboxypeptidase (penicillin-binding protein 5/6)
VNTTKVWKGTSDTLELALSEDVFLTIPRGSEKHLVANVHVDQVIEAPILEGQALGNLVITLNNEELLNVPVVALNSVEQAGLISRMVDSVILFFKRLFQVDS